MIQYIHKGKRHAKIWRTRARARIGTKNTTTTTITIKTKQVKGKTNRQKLTQQQKEN